MDWVVKPRRVVFAGKNAVNELRELCQADERHTVVSAITKPSQVLLHPATGLTAAEGLRFNTSAFRQVCQLVGGNLNSVISGVWQESKVGDAVKRDTLLRVYNNIVKLRFEALTKYRYIADSGAGEIVGLVSRKYQRVPNVDLLVEVLAAAGLSYNVIQASLDNRDMFVLLGRRGSAVVAGDATWSQGVAVYNSETSKRAVHLPLVVFDSTSKSYCLEPETKSNRLVHRKSKGFHQTLDAIVQTAMRREAVVEDIALQSNVAWRAQAVVPGVVKEEAIKRVKRSLLAKGFSTAVVDRITHLLGEAGVPLVTRKSLYVSVLTTADESVSSSRPLRVFASTLLKKGV